MTRHTAGVPPENTARLDALLSPVHGTLSADDIAARSRVEASAPRALIADVLRVHDYGYVRSLLLAVGALTPEDDAAGGVGHLDGDTAVSR